ncbi:MAG: phosphatidate cytidylyltransferase, partial [Firmicutes bacterium]|nr:phosphatidate cytidylyltransferase [Bacillota bacterium]
MLIRIISSVVGLPILLFFVIMGGLTMKIGLLFLSLVGLYELYHAVSGENKAVHIFGYAAAIVYILLLGVPFENADVIFAALFILAMSSMVVMHKKINVKDAVYTVFGVIYVPIMFGFLYLLREEHIYGQYIIYLPFFCAFGCDTGAYFAGRKFGKKKLIPDLSPKKTVEGAVGGTLSAMVLTAIYGFIIGKWFVGENTALLCAVFALIGLIGAIFSQFGDLTASAIKRTAGVKDYGKIM